MPKLVRTTVGLVVLLAAIDQLYRWLHPQVDLERACLVGATAWVVLRSLALLGMGFVPAWRGALVVFTSAFASVLLIESGWLVSRSPASVAVHVALVVAATLATAALPRGATRWRGAFRFGTRAPS